MTNNTNKLHFATRQIHGGYHIDETCARGIAIHPTAAFHFKSCDTAANLFSLSEAGNIYTRLNNPTNTDFENRVASLYGGVGALAVSSGMAAITVIVTSLASRGDNIVASPYLYGGTYNSFRITLRNLGIECRIAEDDSNESIEKLIDQNTKLIYLESMGNPTCDVVDIEGISKIAKHYDLPLVVDNTFGGCGYLCNPFDWGANIVLESATKWINGHGTAIGGVIVDGGNYNWGNGKYPQIDGPSEGYHGLNLWEAFGSSAFIVKARVDGLRDLGCSPSPFDTYLHLIGLETLSLRIEHQVAATRRLAEYCRTSPFIKKVSYVGFENHRSYANARKYFKHGASGVLNIELKGDVESTVRFVEALQLCANMVMIGDSITVVTHPASTTHKQLSDADLKAAGVTPTLLRISLGLEDVEDIISDFEQAFKKDREMKEYHYEHPFELESGASLPSLTIAYDTYGTLNANADNVVWVCHALTANSDVADWWPHTVERGRFLDPEKYFIVCANFLGSHYGTTGPLHINPQTGNPWYNDFPPFTIRDMVQAHRLLAAHLGISQVELLVGSSIGGFQCIEWCVIDPTFARHAALIATAESVSPWVSAFNESQRMAIKADKTFGMPSPTAGAEGLAVARSIAMLSYRGEAAYNLTQTDSFSDGELFRRRVHSYQQHQGEKLKNRFNAYSYFRITQAMESHHVGRGRGGIEKALATIRAKCLVVAISSDILFPPESHSVMVENIPNVEYKVIDSSFGHDGFLVESDKLDRIIQSFLNK